jgi:hypothetical protein
MIRMMAALSQYYAEKEAGMTAGTAVAHILKTLPAAAGDTFLALFPIVNPFGGVPIFFL